MSSIQVKGQGKVDPVVRQEKPAGGPNRRKEGAGKGEESPAG
jgi:hypothetical protein